MLKSRRIDATVDLANLLEDAGWSTPTNSSDDLLPRGIPYWLNKLNASTSSTGAFSGQTIRYRDATTSTTKGGIDGSTTANARWRNYAFTYTGIDSQFVKNMRRAFHATKFVSPMIAKDLSDGPKSKFKLYMNLNTLVEYEDLVTKQNDNNGADLDPYHGNTSFRKVPIIYAPPLDADIDGAVYGVNHNKFFPIVLTGDWLRENEPMFDVEQHNVMTTFIDCSYQYFCNNVRLGGFVGHTVTAT
jgi:hypothetical protein